MASSPSGARSVAFTGLSPCTADHSSNKATSGNKAADAFMRAIPFSVSVGNVVSKETGATSQAIPLCRHRRCR
jgi:hypothetical protein